MYGRSAFILGAVLLGLSACSSGSSSGSGSGSYTLAAGALNPTSVTAGSASRSTITVTPASGYTGAVTLSCSMITGGTPAPAALNAEHFINDKTPPTDPDDD